MKKKKLEKDVAIGWMAYEKNCAISQGDRLIIRQIFSKRKYFWKAFPNCKAHKVRITIEEI